MKRAGAAAEAKEKAFAMKCMLYVLPIVNGSRGCIDVSTKPTSGGRRHFHPSPDIAYALHWGICRKLESQSSGALKNHCKGGANKAAINAENAKCINMIRGERGREVGRMVYPSGIVWYCSQQALQL